MNYDPNLTDALVSILAFILGSVNFSILLFKILKKGDPRDRYSRNAGATNVYRQAGILWAAMVLVLDIGRAVGIAWLAFRFAEGPWITWVALFLVLGNRYPMFHGFHGGKGVATFLGFSAYISPYSAVGAMGAWLIVWRLTGHPFLGSIVLVLTLTFQNLLYLPYHPATTTGAMLTTLFIVWCHKSNIRAFFCR
jgi:acyl phosphate:glycerol-3-phosphate acyltransferase